MSTSKLVQFGNENKNKTTNKLIVYTFETMGDNQTSNYVQFGTMSQDSGELAG